MSKKIKAEQLTPGMFVHDFNCSWMNHPFLGNKTKVKDESVDGYSRLTMAQQVRRS